MRAGRRQAVVALMVGSVRSFALVYHSRDGSAKSGRGDLRSMHTRRISRDCARESAYVVIGAQGPVFSLLLLVWCCLWWLRFVRLL
jgi:hypothetical protein